MLYSSVFVSGDRTGRVLEDRARGRARLPESDREGLAIAERLVRSSGLPFNVLRGVAFSARATTAASIRPLRPLPVRRDPARRGCGYCLPLRRSPRRGCRSLRMDYLAELRASATGCSLPVPMHAIDPRSLTSGVRAPARRSAGAQPRSGLQRRRDDPGPARQPGSELLPKNRRGLLEILTTGGDYDTSAPPSCPFAVVRVPPARRISREDHRARAKALGWDPCTRSSGRSRRSLLREIRARFTGGVLATLVVLACAASGADRAPVPEIPRPPPPERAALLPPPAPAPAPAPSLDGVAAPALQSRPVRFPVVSPAQPCGSRLRRARSRRAPRAGAGAVARRFSHHGRSPDRRRAHRVVRALPAPGGPGYLRLGLSPARHEHAKLVRIGMGYANRIRPREDCRKATGSSGSAASACPCSIAPRSS